MNKTVLHFYEGLWAGLAAPLVRRLDAEQVHHLVIEGLRAADAVPLAVAAAGWLNRGAFPHQPTVVGGVTLPHPAILAAGFVKGDGFSTEADALQAAARRNIIPGWRAMPALVGPVEFGSFTPQPRVGNSGRVLWRDDETASTQNRIGLRNPGAAAAARFLAARAEVLPAVWGVNLAPTPGSDGDDELSGLLRAAAHFQAAFAGQPNPPRWFTLNLSCPNTEDDPGARQTEAKTERLCAALVQAVDAPVWVKVSPGLADDQIGALVRAASREGARAVIATNTLAQPAPSGAIAGVGGGRLRSAALATLRAAQAARVASAAPIDLIACGGLLTGADVKAAWEAGANAVMMYSALVFRGVLAAALILSEAGLNP